MMLDIAKTLYFKQNRFSIKIDMLCNNKKLNLRHQEKFSEKNVR